MTGRTRSWIAILTGFLALAVLATWPLVTHLGTALPNDLGDPLLNAWILGWDADRVLRGFQGLWNAPILYPVPNALAFSEHLLGIAIPVGPVVWLTGNAIAAYNVAFILTYVLAAVGMFLLARSITRSTGAAVIAALAFAFCPARSDQIMHLQVLASGWMPICLWGLHRYFDTGSQRSLAVSAAAFAWQALSNLYFLYFLALPVAVALAFECAARRKELKQRIGNLAAELATAGIAVLIVLAPVVAVYLGVRRTYGLHRSYGDLLNFSADVSSYFHVVDTVRLWARWLAPPYTPERQVFPGLVVIVLAAASLRVLSRPGENEDRTKTYALCYLTITALAFLLSLGPEPSAWGAHLLPFSPYLWLSKIVPGLDGLRAPARFAVVVQLGLCVLAAIGCARMTRRWSVAVLLGAAIVADGWAAPIRLVAFDARGRASERPLYGWLASLPRAGVLELPIKEWAVSPTLTYQYATLFHHHQIVNGYSGYGSTLQAWLGGPLSPLRDLSTLDTTLDALRAVGIRYVLVHPKDFEDRGLAERTLDRLRELSPMMEEIGEFEDTTGFMLHERRPGASLDVAASTLVPPDRFRATASDRPDLLSAAFDRDLDSRWSTEHGQRGDEWLRVDFDRPISIAGIRLQLASRSVGDYPRGLIVAGVNEQGEEIVLHDGPVLAELAKGLVADGDYPWMDIPLATSGPLASIVLKQTGVMADRYWSIHEMQILAR